MAPIALPIPLDRMRIGNAGYVQCPPSWHWGARASPLIMNEPNLWLVLDGRGTLLTSAGTFPLVRGDCFILKPGLTIVGTHEPRRPLEVRYTRFAASGAYRRLVEREWPLHRRLVDVTFLASLLSRMLEAHQRVADCREARAWLSAALHEVVRVDREEPHTGEDKERAGVVERAAAQIARDPAKWPSIAALALSVGYSPDHLTRLFKKYKGLTPQEYAVRIRLDRAAALLQTSSLGIGQIAARLGYTDVHFFSRQFKKRLGVSPSDWRRGG